MRTAVCDLLKCDVPIFAFSHCRDVVVEVTKAGGFGVLGAVSFSPEQLEKELRWIDAHVGGKGYEARARIDRAQRGDYYSSPAGQVVGTMTADTSVREVMYNFLTEYADTMERMAIIRSGQ